MTTSQGARNLANGIATVAGLWLVGSQAICWLFGPFRDERMIALVCDWSRYGAIAMVFAAMIVEYRGRRSNRRNTKS